MRNEIEARDPAALDEVTSDLSLLAETIVQALLESEWREAVRRLARVMDGALWDRDEYKVRAAVT